MVMQGSEGGGGGVAVVVCGGAVNNALRSRYPRSGGGGGRSVEENLDSPIMFFMFFHRAIGSELDELHLSALAFATGKLADIQSLVERYRFVRSIYKHHCNAEDEVFPLLIEKFSVEEQASLVWQFLCSIPVNTMKKFLPWLSFSTSADEYQQMCKCLRKVIPKEKLLQQVLPLARKHFSFKRQRELLFQSLSLMPLKLTERVLPWLVRNLTEDETRNFLKNMQLAAPPTDAALVTLYSGWACKGRHHGVCLSSNVAGRCLVKQYTNRVVEENCVRGSCPYALHLQNADEQAVKRNLQISIANEIMSGGAVGQNSLNTAGNELSCCVPGLGVNSYNLGLNSTSKCFHPLSFSSSAPSLSPSIFIWETNNGSHGIDHEVHPMDTIFKFHKAILKDLEYLDVESGKLSYCDESILLQFMGRFQLLWSLYRAHSNAEDEIVFPALESLHNVSHSYTLDHKQEEELLEDISRALCDLTELHERMKGDAKVQNFNLTPLDDADYGEDCRRNYDELATKL